MKNLLFVVFVLSFFCLHAQNYTSLEEALKNAEDAKELDLRNQELEIVPSEVFQLKNLNERLEISDAPKISQEENAPSPDVFIWVSQEPQPLNMGEIVNLIGYPEEAKERNIEGEVVARILVDKEGNYVQHKLVRKAHPILVNAVEAQIPKLKFSPAKRENEPIMFWVNIPLIFKL